MKAEVLVVYGRQLIKFKIFKLSSFYVLISIQWGLRLRRMWFGIQYYIYSIYIMCNIKRPNFGVWHSVLVAGKSIVNLSANCRIISMLQKKSQNSLKYDSMQDN